MNKIINIDNLRRFAYVNDQVCTRPIKGIVISFFGLGGSSMYNTDNDQGLYFGDRGILYVVPYTNPWAWMNKQAIDYTDEIIDVLVEEYELGNDIPVVSTGGSMGGLAALVYTKYAKRTPVACVANCPVCDLPYHFTERPDLPRTIYSAFFNCEDFDKALCDASPLHLAQNGALPDIFYDIFHCDKDMAVNIDAHTRRLIPLLNKDKLRFTVVADKGHCELPQREWDMYIAGMLAPFEE